jgi:hypothetical protein
MTNVNDTFTGVQKYTHFEPELIKYLNNVVEKLKGV